MTTQMQNPKRVRAEIELLSTHFGDVQFNPDDPSTVIIERFDLPRGFNRSYCQLLIDLGRYYSELPPQNFYLSRGLRKNGLTIPHYFEDWSGKKYCKQGWAWFCLQIESWKPNPYSMLGGDNLLTVTNACYDALKMA